MALPLFLLFCVYGVVNAYLPILLSTLGYSATDIGFLQGLFEFSGLLFPIFISAKVDRKGTYGFVMVALGVLMIAILPPLVRFPVGWVTAPALALFAIGYKGAVPVADSLVSRILGNDRSNYGRVRVFGSIGFVCITLALQFSGWIRSDDPASIATWLAIPAALFVLSVIFLPGLLARRPPTDLSAEKSAVTESSAPSDSPETIASGSFARGMAKLRLFPRSFWFGIVLIFLGFFGMTPSQRFFSLYVHDYLHLESYSGLWALSAAAEVPFMFLSGWFFKKYGAEKILVVSLVAITARNLTYAAIPTFEGAIIGQLFHSVCFGLFHPAAVVFVAERAPKHLLAIGMTLYTSVSVGLASVVGNVAGGIIIDTLGYRPLFVIFSVFPVIGVCAFAWVRRARAESLTPIDR